MAGNSTVYDVRVKYALDDRASKNANGMASSFDRAAKGAFSLKGALAAIGGGFAIKKGYDALIGFNSEIDQMKIGLGAVLQMQLHLPFAKARQEADKLFLTFQELAKKSPATTKDFMEMGNAIAPAVAMLGGGPDKIAKLAQGGVIASMAFGERADVVGRDIKQMLTGQVTERDPLANQLLASRGISRDKFNNEMTGQQRGALVESMLQDPALLKAADQMGESFAGQISTFKDQLQMTLGNVGKPLMASLTDEVRKWNTWIEKHPKLINEYVTKFGNMIKGAFEFVRNVTGWLVENRDLLFSVAKVFLVFKGAQIGTNIFKKFADGMGNLVGDLKNSAMTVKGLFTGGGSGTIGGAFGSLVGVLKGAGGVIPALFAFKGALDLAVDLLNTHRESDKKARNAQISLQEATGEFPKAQRRKEELQRLLSGKSLMGDLSPDMRSRFATELESLEKTVYSPEKLGEIIRKISDESEKHGGHGFKDVTPEQFYTSAANFLPDLFDSRDTAKSKKITQEVIEILEMTKKLGMGTVDSVLRRAFPEQYGGVPKDSELPSPSTPWKNAESGKIEVNIHKIEVASEDPDRFVFGLAKIGEQAAKHPTSSQHTTPGGF